MTWWRPLTVGLLIGLLIGLLLILLAGPAEARHFQRACPHHTGQGIVAREKYIRCEDRRIGAPRTGGQIITIGRCESGPDLLAGWGSHVGTFQHDPDYWPGRWRTWGRGNHPGDGDLDPSPVRFRTNVIVTLRMARAQGWGAWSCA